MVYVITAVIYWVLLLSDTVEVPREDERQAERGTVNYIILQD